MNNKIFIDTSAFKAISDNKDEFHDKSKDILGKLIGQQVHFVTSNFIIDETVTLLRKRCGLTRVKEFVNKLEEGNWHLKIYRTSIKDEQSAWNWFWKDWSGLSFTDSVSFSMMERLAIKKAFTFDNHFAKAGFEVIE